MRMTEKRCPSEYQLYESYNAQQVPFYPLNQTIVLSLTAVEHNTTTTTTNTNNNTTTAILKLDQNGHVWKSIETSRRKGRTTTSKNNMTFAFYHFQSKTNDTTPITFRIQTDAWIQRLHQLATFEKIHGHCHVANTKRSLVVESNASLNRWIIEQRQKKRNGQLSMERQLLLESIPSFDWEPKDTAWMFLYQTYKAYSLEYTTTNTTTTIPYAQFHPRLASWISTQRHLMKHGKLSKQRQDLLMQLGFQFTSVNKWRNQFLKLQQFQQTHGHCLVPQEDPVLGQWVNRQRRSLPKLSNEQRSLLESIGFQWSIYPTWDEMYNQLKIYKETNGHCCVPTSSTSTNSSICTSLGRWVYNQRQAYKQNHLSKERKQLLDDLGLDWDPSNTTWTNFYNALKQYQAIHNTSYISYKDTTADPSLRLWVVTQRQLYQKQLLSSERKQRLNEIVFEFSLKKKKTWLEHYHTLCSFSSNSNSSNNSSTRSMLPPHLSQWLKRQRYLYTKGYLSEPRQQLLNTLIETEPSWWIQQWNVSKQPTKSRTWMEHYTALTKFQQDHWHCRVPLTSSLGKWVQTQRKELLTMEQQRMLNELGFQWSFSNSDGTH